MTELSSSVAHRHLNFFEVARPTFFSRQEVKSYLGTPRYYVYKNKEPFRDLKEWQAGRLSTGSVLNHSTVDLQDFSKRPPVN